MAAAEVGPGGGQVGPGGGEVHGGESVPPVAAEPLPPRLSPGALARLRR